jgi:CheY-like chemotaxis protein
MAENILLVDDEPANLRALRRILGEERTAAVVSAEEALELLGEQEFDVIISDNSMPGRSGVELLTEVASSYPRMRRIMFSGSKPDNLDDLERRGVIDVFVLKPGFKIVASLLK